MHFLAGAATAYLLTSDNKPNVVYNVSTPLTKEQAETYQNTKEYNDRLTIRCKALFL